MEEIIYKKLSEIKFDPTQPRKHFDEQKLKEMSTTFKMQGVVNPVEIDSKGFLVTGELRYRMAKLAGLKEIPCKVLKNLNPMQRLERQLVENLNRSDLELIDLLPALKKLLWYYNSLPKKEKRRILGTKRGELNFQSFIAKRLGMNESWLSNLLNYNKNVPEDIIPLIEHKKVPITRVMKIKNIKDDNLREAKWEDVRSDAKVTVRAPPIRRTIFQRINNWLDTFHFDALELSDKEEARILKARFEAIVLPFYQKIVKKAE